MKRFELAIADHTLEVRRVIASTAVNWLYALATLRELRSASVAHSISRNFPTYLSDSRIDELIRALRSSGMDAAARELAKVSSTRDLLELYVVKRPTVQPELPV